MSNESEDTDAAEPPISADAAKHIAAEHLASEILARTVGSATVEFGVGQFFGAPTVPVWLVRPLSSSDRVGGSLVIAVCPWTGQVLYRRRAGE